jgi:hypothetical protein
MPTIETDATLGRIIYTDKAIQKMSQYGLYRFHIVDTLKHGFNVKPLIPGTYQRYYVHQQEKEISVIFTTLNHAGEELGAIRVITCWAKDFK